MILENRERQTSANLTISRTAFMGIGMPMKICLDNKEIGEIYNNSQIYFSIPAGRHVLTARNFFGSEITRPIAFDANVGENLTFNIRAATPWYAGFNPVLMAAFIFSKKKRVELMRLQYAFSRVN